ncbi:dCTP deaminase [Curtobacterium sp. L1-20]|uniref:dCTP deaminase n=1 Tax=Curtobacterium sp. L1-20 TaxID=3138181 RepID=UPI003B52D585
MTAVLENEIYAAMAETELDRKLIITPLLDAEQQVGPGTIDLRLGTEFLETDRMDDGVVDVVADDAFSRYREGRRTYVQLGGTYTLPPQGFLLGSTLEFVGMPHNMHGQVLSRSSWGRLGLIVATAVVVQPGYRGMLTLELVNTSNAPIVLRPGLRVAQLQLWRAESMVTDPYRSSDKYISPLGPEAARLARERNERDKLLRMGERLEGKRRRH